MNPPCDFTRQRSGPVSSVLCLCLHQTAPSDSILFLSQVNRADHEFQVSPFRRRDQAGLAAPRSIRLGMLYNDVFQDQLEVLASDFESLAKQRANSRRIYPLVTYETLIYKFVVQLRSQARKLLYHLEHMQKSVARPHVVVTAGNCLSLARETAATSQGR